MQRRRRALNPLQADEQTRDVPTVMAARLVLALARGACEPTVAGAVDYLGVYRSTAFRLLSRLVEAGILTKRRARRSWVPPTWVYAVAPEHMRKAKQQQHENPAAVPEGEGEGR